MGLDKETAALGWEQETKIGFAVEGLCEFCDD